MNLLQPTAQQPINTGKTLPPRAYHPNLKIRVSKTTLDDGEEGVHYDLILNEKAIKKIGYKYGTITLNLNDGVLSISLDNGVPVTQMTYNRVMLSLSQAQITYVLDAANIPLPQKDYYLLIGKSFQHEGITHYTLVREGDSNTDGKEK